MRLTHESKGIIAMLILSIIYGVAGFTARTLQNYFGIWQQLATQSWAAFFMLKAIQAAGRNKRAHMPLSTKDLTGLFGRAIIGRVVSSYFFIQACLFAPLGNIGWISALPTSVLFGWWLFGQCVSRRDWLLLAAGMVGVGIIVGPDIDLKNISGQGELYGLVSVLASGLAALFGRSTTREHGAIFATGWVLLFTSLLTTLAAFLFEGGLKVPPIDALPMLALVSVMVGLGSACSLYGYSYLRASTATALLSLEAVWAVLLGVLIYGEQPTLNSLFGGGVIVGVAYLITPASKQKSVVGSMEASIPQLQ